jgi:peroxiredoxin
MLLFLATMAAPLYLGLDAARILPLPLRDRPWPFALAAVILPLVALRRSRKLRTMALSIALASAAAVGVAAHLRYRLPPSSPGAGVGTPLPDLTLSDESGHPTRLRDDRPLLIVWFRGSWCPYCRKQLAELAAEMPHFSDGNFRLLAISADPPEPLAKLKDSLRLPFSLISDPGSALVNRCELAHCVAIADGKGVIRWGVVSGNWEKDLPARALLQAAWRAQ